MVAIEPPKVNVDIPDSMFDLVPRGKTTIVSDSTDEKNPVGFVKVAP